MKVIKYSSLVITLLITLLICLTGSKLHAQVGIHSSTINGSSSAMLDVFSTDKGLLIPRLSAVQRGLIPSPAAGLLIFNTTTGRYNYFTGAFWYQIETTFVSAITGTGKPGGGVSVSSDPGKQPDSSAMLDASDPNRGFLFPRTTPGLISAPENGLIIYDMSANLLKYYFENEWFPVCAVTTGQPGISGNQAAIGVAINKTGAQAHQSAILDVSAPDKGILIPRLTAAQRDGLYAVAGLTIFNTTSRAIEYFDGSNWLRMNIILPASVTIAATASTVCSGTQVTFTATEVNGGQTPSYQWKKNNIPLPGATNSTYAYVPANLDVVAVTMTSSSVCVSGSPAASNSISMTVNPQLPVTISISPSANYVCAGTSVTFSSTIANGGTNPLYQWILNGTDVPGTTNSTYTFVPVNNNVVSCRLTSNALCATGSPATSNAVIMAVIPLLPVSISISPSDNNVCAGTSVTFTSTIVNGGSAPPFQWKLNGNNIAGATNSTYTYVPANTDAISCSLISNAICTSGNPATSNIVTMTVNPLLPVGITITRSGNNVCAGTSVTFNSNITNGGTSPQYQWRLNGSAIAGATNATYAYIPVNTHAISCVLTSNATCAIDSPALSNVLTMTVNPLLFVTISIAPTANNVCAGTSVTFNATITNGGTAPQYQWQLNGIAIPGATNATYTSNPANNTVISCVLTSNAICAVDNPAASNEVSMTVYPLLPVSITIVPSENNICAGTSVTYTSTITNGGPAPLYQWRLNGSAIAGATSTVYTYVPGNNQAITCVLTSNAICAVGNPAVSNTVNMIVNPLLPVSISVTPSANDVCAGASVTFSTTIGNGGTSPLYQWKLNGTDIVGATSSTYTYVPENNHAISSVLTSNAICSIGNPAISNIVTMTVFPLLPVSISVAPSANPVCAGTQVTFTPTIVNGGSSPQYQWKLNGTNITGATNATYTFTPVNGNTITSVLTSNAICATGTPAVSNAETMTVHPLLPVSISITASVNDICAETPVTYSSTIINGGAVPLYQWKLNGTDIPGATNNAYTYAPANTDAISCMLTSNATCATGNPATSNVVSMIVHPLLPVSITIVASQNPICPGTTVNYTSTIINGGSAPVYQWKINGMNIVGATSTTYSYTVSNNDLITCVLTSNALCAVGTPATSNTVTMNVTPFAPVKVTVAASTPIVIGTTVTFTATPVNGGASPVYQWKLNGTNITGATNATYAYPAAINDQVATVLTSSASCAIGSPATSNTVIILDSPARPASITIAPSLNPVCAGSNVTLTATPLNGGATPTYQWKLGGANITGATNVTYTYVPVNNNVITCVLVPSGGTPVTSNSITMSVIPNVPVSVALTASVYAVMPGTQVTYTATPVNQGTVPVYQWKVNGVNAGTNSTSFSYTPADHDKVTCVLTSNYSATCLTNNPATSNAITMVVYMTGAPCAGIPTVTYGGMTYNTVQVGTQCWLREGLNIGTMVVGTANQLNNGIPEKYCYNNSDMNCNVYGGLYQWGELVQYVNGATNSANWNPVPTGNVQGLCPAGWHIPTNAEWGTLMTSQGGQTVAGGKLKETTLAHYATPNTGATNSSGFTALPGGLRWYTTGAFFYISNDANFWTISAGANPATDVFYGGASTAINAATNGQFYKSVGLSVRCLKN